MLRTVQVIKAISNTSSSNEKMLLLKANANTPKLKDILRFIYNPYCKTGISNAKLEKALTAPGGGALYPSWLIDGDLVDIALDYFSKNQTGNSKDLMVAKEFILGCGAAYNSQEAMDLAKAIVTQDLKIGVSATTLNKVFGADFIPKTGCMLGTPYDSVGEAKTKWPCIVTEKLDGVRRILVKEKGVCRFYSRSGHEDTGLVEILEEAKHLPDNFVYDGELLAKGTFKDSIALRQATNSIANLKGTKTGLIFNIFDMVPVDSFYAGTCNVPAIDRKTRLAATLGDESLQVLRPDDWAQVLVAYKVDEDLQHIAAVPILGLVHSLDEASEIVEGIWARGGEGIMLNTTVGPYEIKRSKHLLKVKHTEEYVLPVVDAIEGTGKYEDSLGAIVVEYKGQRVGVGSGFTDAQRKDIWEHPAKYRGMMAEIETFGESINAQGSVSLNCPIFKRFVGEEE